MPNKFEGQVQDNFDRKLKDVKVTLTGTGIPLNTFTKTDENGKWIILLKQSIESKDVTVTFTKLGLESRQVTNPQPTEVLNGYIDPEKGGTLDLKGLYKSGTYLVSSLSIESKEVLNQELEDLFQFIKNHPGNTKITITSSESQVTNADNDKANGIDRTNEFRKIPGSLAKARAEALQKYVDTFLDKKYIENPNLDRSGRPTIEFGEIDRQGDEDWERYYTPSSTNPNVLVVNERPEVISANNKALKEYNANPLNIDDKISRTADLPKYKKDQYTRITVELANKDCLANNLVFDVMYIGTNHHCNSAIFQMDANGQLLLRDDGANYASLNNGLSRSSVEGTGYPMAKKAAPFGNTSTGYNNYVRLTEDRTAFTKVNLRRFKYFQKGEVFPLNDLTPPTVAHYEGSHRYNRFILTSSKLKELTAGLEEKIITFSMTCWRPPEYGTKETRGYVDGQWGWYNCHKGVGSFKLYKVKVQNNAFVVDFASEVLEGITPYDVGKPLWLFKYDVCNDKIELNTDAFSKEAIRKANLEGG
jgi:hypothetical protein